MGRLDLVGTLLLSATLVALLLPLAQTAAWGWGSARVVGLLSLSAVLLVVFGWSQTRIREPLVDLVALRRRPIVLTNVASILFGFALFASMIGTAGYVQAPEATGYGFGSSILVSGLAMLPGGLMMLFFAPVAAAMIRVFTWDLPFAGPRRRAPARSVGTNLGTPDGPGQRKMTASPRRRRRRN